METDDHEKSKTVQ